MSSGTYTEPLNYATNFNVPLLIRIVVCSTGLTIKNMTEIEVLDKNTEGYIQHGINWDAHENEAIIAANKSELAKGDIEQLASDSFQEGWFAATRYFESKK